jgi:hypothetical protein
MTKRLSSAVYFLVLVSFFFGLWEPLTQAQEKPDGRYRSPRATVRTLLTAATLARGSRGTRRRGKLFAETPDKEPKASPWPRSVKA